MYTRRGLPVPRERATFPRLLAAFARLGRPGRDVAVGLDVLLSAGPAHAFERRRHERLRRQARAAGDERAVSEIWVHAARELGAETVPLPGGFVEIRKDGRRTRIWNHWVMLDDIVTARLALDKVLVHHLLAEAGLPIPAHVGFRAGDLSLALAFLAEAGPPCVVKPAGGAGAAGTTPGVRSAAQLRRAALRAGRRHDDLLIEKQVPGDVYRLLFLDGELLDVVRRLPPAVTGDGRLTVGELIAAENRRRLAGPTGPTGQLTIDLDCLFTLEASGRTLDTIPAAGERVRVKTAINQNGPKENRSATGELSTALLAEAALAVEVAGVRLAGVDVITPDPARALADSGGVILEVNATPALHYHYEVADRERATPVAVPVLRRLLETAAEPTRVMARRRRA
jgi:D-alanine-D-alanine ligase-like ATP-grasp enzyme